MARVNVSSNGRSVPLQRFIVELDSLTELEGEIDAFSCNLPIINTCALIANAGMLIEYLRKVLSLFLMSFYLSSIRHVLTCAFS